MPVVVDGFDVLRFMCAICADRLNWELVSEVSKFEAGRRPWRVQSVVVPFDER